MTFFQRGYFQWNKQLPEKNNFPSKKHSYSHFVTEPNVNTYYFTANIDPLKYMVMVDYSAYFILSDRQDKQNLKHMHYSSH